MAPHELVDREDINEAISTSIGLHKIGHIQSGSPKRSSPPCCSMRAGSLDGSNASRHVAELRLKLASAIADILQHGAQVFHVEQQQPVIIGDLEYQGEDALLSVIQAQHAREQKRAHFADGGASGMSLLFKDVPEDHGRGCGVRVRPSFCARSRIFGLSPPGRLIPARSPFTSAMNTGLRCG